MVEDFVSLAFDHTEIVVVPHFRPAVPVAVNGGLLATSAAGEIRADDVPDFPEVTVALLKLVVCCERGKLQVTQVNFDIREATEGDVGERGAMPRRYVIRGWFVGSGAAGKNDDLIEVRNQGLGDRPMVDAWWVEAAAVNRYFFHGLFLFVASSRKDGESGCVASGLWFFAECEVAADGTADGDEDADEDRDVAVIGAADEDGLVGVGVEAFDGDCFRGD